MKFSRVLTVILVTVSCSQVVAQSRQEAERALTILKEALEKKGAVQNTDPEKLFTQLRDERLSHLLHQLKANTVKELDRDQETTRFRAVFENRDFLVSNYRSSRDLQIRWLLKSAERGISNEKLSVVNEWNIKKRFAKAYVDSDGDFVLEADLDLQSGVSEETVQNFVSLFLKIASDYQEHIGDR